MSLQLCMCEKMEIFWIEHIWKFFEFGLLLTKVGRDFDHLARFMRKRQTCLCSFSYCAQGNEPNYAVPCLLMGQIQKTSRYFLFKQEGTV